MSLPNYAVTPHSLEYPIVMDGWIFFGIAFVVGVVFLLLGWEIPGCLLIILALFIGYFFRNPDRVTLEDDHVIVSPADGTILKVESWEEKDYLKGPVKKISIFMSVLNVHVNRMPSDVEVINTRHFPGKFLVASLDKASTDNERTEIVLKRKDGRLLLMKQIAGLVARRIVCHAQPREHYRAGQVFGLIKFGSRLEIFAPPETTILVTAGQPVRAGETVLGYLP